MRRLCGLVISICALTSFAYGAINFGGRDSTIKASGTSKINVLNGMLVQDGTFQKGSNASLIGNDITFTDGTFIRNDAEIFLTGNSQLDKDGKLTLNGGDSFKAGVGVILQDIEVRNKNNKVEGLPSFLSTNAISLYDSNATLTIGVQSVLDKNIVLNSGSLYFGDNLRFGDNARITGAGAVNFNGFRLLLGGKDLTWTDTTRFIKANDIILNANVDLRGQWIFEGDSNLNGNGNIIDLSSGSQLRVKSGSTLSISDVKFKGLGSGSLAYDDNTSRIKLSQVELELDANYTMTIGGLYIDGTSLMMVKDKYLTFDQYATLTVDSGALYYETLVYPDMNNINFTTTSVNFASVGGGTVQTSIKVPSSQYHYSTDFSLGRHIVLTPSKKMLVDSDMTLDGRNYFVYFAKTSEAILTVAAGKTLTLKNVFLNDLAPHHVELGAGASILFDDETVIKVAQGESLNSTWTFNGNCRINGADQYLDLASTGSIVLRSGSLEFDNIRLKGLSGTNLRCLSNTATFSLYDVDLCLDAAFTFSTGYLDMIGDVNILGDSQFRYQTTKQSTIKRNARLMLDNGTIFSYEPVSGSNRDLIAMEDKSATIYMLGATLNSSTVGWRLKKGTLMVDHTSYLTNAGASSVTQGFCFGDGTNDLYLEVLPGASLTLQSGYLDVK